MSDERIAELQPSFEVEEAALEDERLPHVLICVHGIRDNAAWAATIDGKFAPTRFEIACVTYKRLSAIPFLLGLRRKAIQRDVLDQIKFIRQRFPENAISILAHSNGTKIIADLMPFIDFEIEFVFLCGSVCRLDDIRQLRKAKRHLINDQATKDWWPIIAEIINHWLFQATGVYGFYRYPVIERRFSYYHGGGTRRKHIERWVLPTLVHGSVEKTKKMRDPGWRKHAPTYIRRISLTIMLLVFIFFWTR